MTPVKAIDTAGIQDLGKRRKKPSPKLELELGEVPEKIPEFERPLDVEAKRRREERPDFDLELGEVPPVVFPSREEAAEMFVPTPEDLIGRVYPEYKSLTVDSFNEWATTNPDAFVLDMVKNRGRTEDTEMLLRLMTEGAVHDDGTPYTQEEIDQAIDEIFDPEPAQLEIPEGGYKFVTEIDGIRQLLTIDTDYNIKDKDGEIVARYDLETGEIVEPLTPAMKVYPQKPLPVPPPATYEERELRVEAFRDYRKRGGKLHYDLWEKSGMPTDITFAPDLAKFEAQRAVEVRNQIQVFGEALTKIPVQLASSILQAIQGAGGASVVDRDWANRFIKLAQDDLDKFISEVGKMQVGSFSPIKLTDIASLPQNISFSLTSMGAGLGVGLPTALVPLPGFRVAAYITGSSASGKVAYDMASYQIMQQYLEFKNEEQIAETGKGLSAEQEQQLKEDFEDKARAYGLWEALPEAISNLAFFRILTAPLSSVVGKDIAVKILGRITALYGEEFLTETITQKGQAGIEVGAGLRAEDIGWLQAFKEIAPQTFLLTTILGGTGAVTVATVNRIKTSLKTEIGSEHPSFEKVDEGITVQSIIDTLKSERGALGVPEEPNIEALWAKRQPLARKLESLPDDPVTLARLGEVEVQLARAGQLDMARSEESIRAARKFWVERYGSDPAMEEIITRAEKALAEAQAKPAVKPAPPVAAPKPAKEKVTPVEIKTEEDAKALPLASEKVSGLVVRKDIPNQASIESTLEDFEILPGIREIPTSNIGEITQPKFYSVEQEETTRQLAEEIKVSGEINPLIVVVESTGDYILEGSHRLDALRILGIQSFPAQVVINRESIPITEAPVKKARPVKEVKPAPEVEAVKEQAPQVTQEIETVVSDLQAQIAKTSAEVKGKTGEAARISRETLKGLEREAAYAQRTLDAFKGQVNVPEATVLRSTIAAMSKFKGLPKKQLQEIISGVAGKRQLRNLPSNQLAEILEKVREARPVKIGHDKVITPKTEAKIQSLKESLISSRQMTNEIYNHLMERLNLQTDRYEHANKFITETEGKELIRAMNDEVVLAEWDIKVQDSLAKAPAIKEVRDRLNDRGMQGTKVEINGEPFNAKEPSRFWSMRYYMLELQKRLKAPIYDAWQKVNMAHLVARDKHNQKITSLIETTPNFMELISDDVALKRIEDYIASKRKLANIKAPELSEDEMALATELEMRFFGSEDRVRFARFTNAYAENEGDIDLIHKEIPNAPKAALRRAIDIYEGKGAKELRKFTDTQKWGVVGSGYDPRSVIKPILYFRAPKETTFAKGLLRTREGVEYQEEENNIIQRYSRHEKQLIALEEMSGLIRAFGRVYAEHAHKLKPDQQRQTSRDLSVNLNEMKGYHDEKNAIIHHINRLYGQVAAAVFWSPDLVGRNKLQNFAFNTDYWAGRFMDTRNKAISAERRRWFEVFVSQQRVFEADFLMYGEKPYKGFVRLTEWARRTSKYPWSDKSNRAEAFYVRINRVDRALAVYEQDGNVQKLVDDSGLNEFEARQQAEALELLAMDSVDYGIDGMDAVTGREAFALYATQQHVNNVHFLYDRSQRALAEQGEVGKTLGNIMVFSRSWGERFILQANKLSPESKANLKEKAKALYIIVGVIVAGMITGETYKVVTGKALNPYNPLNILTWSPGGLAIGVTTDISTVIYLITQAVQGDEHAFAQLPSKIASATTLALPFYKVAVRALDAITDMKNVDVWALKKIREMVDEEYEVRGGAHEVERTLLEKLQRAIFGFKDEPGTPQEKIEESESILGMDIEVADLPWTIEEPDVHDMRKLNTDLSRILKTVPPEEITIENGYSEKAVAWLKKESYEATWDTLPHKKIYEITELGEEHAKWANRNKRKLVLVTQYQKLEGAEARAFLDEHPELKENPGIEWLKRWPIANAQLALWGLAKIYTTEAYDEFNRLVGEWDVPTDAIPELTLPPAGSVDNYFKYQDMLTDFAPNSWEVQLLMLQDDELRQFLERDPVEIPVRSLELKIQHRPQFDAYDLLESDEERAAYKVANPEWVDNMRRIEAIENAATDETIESWVERGNVIDEFSAGSSEAMVWLLDNQEVFDWALDKTLLTDDGSDWNEPVLRINARWRENDEKYDAIDGDNQEARQAFLSANEQYRQDRRRREAFSGGFPEDQIEDFVNYWELPVKGYEQERFLLEHPELAGVMEIDLPERVPSEKIDALLEKETLSDKDKLQVDAYKLFVPDNLVGDYVQYYSLEKPDDLEERTGSDLWYEDDWWMMEHPDFYKEVYRGIKENQRLDYRTVPTREVFAKYLEYQKVSQGNAREKFRQDNLDLDEWLVVKFGYKSIVDRDVPEVIEEDEDILKGLTEALEEKLRRLTK